MTPKKPAAKKAAKKKPAAKRKPAPKRPPEPEIQTNRTTEEAPPVTETAAPPVEETHDQPEETQEQRDAAGEARRQQVMASGKSDPVDPYEQKHEPLEHEGFDHYAAEEARQAELDDAREEHNRRTGDASL